MGFVMCESKTISTDFHVSSSCSGSGTQAGSGPNSLLGWAPWGMWFTPKCVEWGGMTCDIIGTDILRPPTERTKEPMVCSVLWPNFCSAINISPWAFSHIIFQTGFLASVLIFANASLLLFMSLETLVLFLSLSSFSFALPRCVFYLQNH